MRQQFIDLIEKVGWDAGIEYIETKIKRLTELIDTYWSGYLLAIDDDIDRGECFETRQKQLLIYWRKLV